MDTSDKIKQFALKDITISLIVITRSATNLFSTSRVFIESTELSHKI